MLSHHSFAKKNNLDFILKAITGSLTSAASAVDCNEAAICWSQTGQEGIHLASVSSESAIHGLCCVLFL